MSSYPPPTSGLGVAARVVVNPSAITLAAVGDTYQLAPSLTDIAGNSVSPAYSFTFTSFNPQVVDTDETGLITALAVGYADIGVGYMGIAVDVSVQVSPPEQTSTSLFLTMDRPAGTTFCGYWTNLKKNILTSLVGDDPPTGG